MIILTEVEQDIVKMAAEVATSAFPLYQEIIHDTQDVRDAIGVMNSLADGGVELVELDNAKRDMRICCITADRYAMNNTGNLDIAVGAKAVRIIYAMITMCYVLAEPNVRLI